MNKQTVIYICGDCGKPFRVPQGSRRRFCTRCGNKRVQAGRSRRPVKEERIGGP